MPRHWATSAFGSPSIMRCPASRAFRRQRCWPRSARIRGKFDLVQAASCCPMINRLWSPNSSSCSKRSILAESIGALVVRAALPRQCDALRYDVDAPDAWKADLIALRAYLNSTSLVTARRQSTGPIPMFVLATGRGMTIAARLGLDCWSSWVDPFLSRNR